MCRHIAYVGAPIPLRTVLTDPPYGLVRQSWAPRNQVHGTVNADGFGLGWYADGDPIPARYRRDRPLWADQPFVDIARAVTSHAMVAAVRDGTAGMGYGEEANAPFSEGKYLFSHNGAVKRWKEMAHELAPADMVALSALTDSSWLFGMTLHRLRSGASLAEALTEVVRLVIPLEGRVNLLACDGSSIAATTWDESLFWRELDGGVVVASEPYDDEPGWTEVPDKQLLTATPAGVEITSLKD